MGVFSTPFLLAVTALFLPSTATASVGECDFVIVGGGTSGLVLANRLSAIPGVTVGVIEPGGDVRGNPNVTKPTSWLKNMGTGIDWQYTTSPQSAPAPPQQNGSGAGAGGGRVLTYHAGKAVGGTSTINGMTYIRADRAEIDAWETLGNVGWNWSTLYHYYVKSENFTPPTLQQQSAGGASYDPAYHGVGGNVKVGFLPELDLSGFEKRAETTWATMGYGKIQDVNGGSVKGFDVWPMTVDVGEDTRWDAGRAYYWSVAARPNLSLIKGTATRVLWLNGSCGEEVVASGVEYLDAEGNIQVLGVKREVVLSAGSLRTPLILEASGVGDPRALRALGVEVKVDLPGVGENLQDQPNVDLIYSGTVNVTGYPPYATFATAQELFGSNASSIAAVTRMSIPQWAKQIEQNGGLNASAVEKVLRVQHDLIFGQNVTVAEMLTTASGRNLVSAFWALLPFSRGGVHLRSTATRDMNDPIIDPGFFTVDFDMQTQTAIGRLAQQFWESEPMRDLVTGSISPGDAVLPQNATDEQWASYIGSSFTPNLHPIGTAAMMSRDLGGVVGPELRVYGTRNVRVVDASVIPLQVSGHLTATLYAIAERASEMILDSLVS